MNKNDNLSLEEKVRFFPSSTKTLQEIEDDIQAIKKHYEKQFDKIGPEKFGQQTIKVFSVELYIQDEVDIYSRYYYDVYLILKFFVKNNKLSFEYVIGKNGEIIDEYGDFVDFLEYDCTYFSGLRSIWELKDDFAKVCCDLVRGG